jgi:signal transduction histidine kinase
MSSNRWARFAAFAVTAAVAFLLLSFPLHPLNGVIVDSFFRVLGRTSPDPQFFLIAMDASITQGGEASISADVLADLVSRLNKGTPRAIGILADVDDKHYSSTELTQLVGAVASNVPLFIGFTDEVGLGRPIPVALGDRVTFAPGIVSRDSYHFGADSVSRRVMFEIDRTPTFFSRLATFIRGTTPTRVESLGNSKHAFIWWRGPAGTYPVHSAAEILRKETLPWDIAGKTVLLGYTRRSRPTQDFILTPYSRQLGDTPLLEGAAQGLATLVSDSGLRRLPSWIVTILTLAVALGTVFIVSSLSPSRGILFMFALLTSLWCAGLGALAWAGWWLDLAHAGLMAVIAYYLVVPFRLGMEYRRRWHYQQQTEMMFHLEQIKSNFLSLVSHDLKTPIARIQGNAELLLRESLAQTEKARKGLAAIITTTEQMSDYVESVLDLTRIEAAKVPIKKESRDINATLLEAIEEKRFLANEKNIAIEHQLEPLFSIRYDVKLMKRVFANLLENAVKYSPSGTTIRVASREEGEKVRVSISDQGFGISPADQEKVFQRFFRAENPAISGVKGTGLGLYLVKYFVELHKGIVSLKSEIGKGSTFEVALPVEGV